MMLAWWLIQAAQRWGPVFIARMNLFKRSRSSLRRDQIGLMHLHIGTVWYLKEGLMFWSLWMLSQHHLQNNVLFGCYDGWFYNVSTISTHTLLNHNQSNQGWNLCFQLSNGTSLSDIYFLFHFSLSPSHFQTLDGFGWVTNLPTSFHASRWIKRDYIGNGRCMLTVWRIIALEVEGKKLAVKVSFSDGWKHFLAVGGVPVAGTVSHTWMQVTQRSTSFYSTGRRQEWLLLTSQRSSLCIFILLILQTFFLHCRIAVIFLIWFGCVIYSTQHWRL